MIFDHQHAPPSITTDHDALVRILDNIISNAIKFSRPGKTVTVAVASEKTCLRFEMKDEGPGIRLEERHKLFRKFQKLSARPTDGESSTGLGLSIVKDLVDLLNGTIEIESEYGKGTNVIVRLPLQS